MIIIGFVSDSAEWEKNVGGKTYTNKLVEVEGMRIRAKPKMSLPQVGREVRCSVSVQWHKGTNGNGGADKKNGARPWASYDLQGWSYTSAKVEE